MRMLMSTPATRSALGSPLLYPRPLYPSRPLTSHTIDVAHTAARATAGAPASAQVVAFDENAEEFEDGHEEEAKEAEGVFNNASAADLKKIVADLEAEGGSGEEASGDATIVDADDAAEDDDGDDITVNAEPVSGRQCHPPT